MLSKVSRKVSAHFGAGYLRAFRTRAAERAGRMKLAPERAAFAAGLATRIVRLFDSAARIWGARRQSADFAQILGKRARYAKAPRFRSARAYWRRRRKFSRAARAYKKRRWRTRGVFHIFQLFRASALISAEFDLHILLWDFYTGRAHVAFSEYVRVFVDEHEVSLRHARAEVGVVVSVPLGSRRVLFVAGE